MSILLIFTFYSKQVGADGKLLEKTENSNQDPPSPEDKNSNKSLLDVSTINSSDKDDKVGLLPHHPMYY